MFNLLYSLTKLLIYSIIFKQSCGWKNNPNFANLKRRSLMKKLFIISLLLLTISLGLFAPTTFAEDEITLVEANWPGIRAKNAVASYILDNIGYQTETTMLSDQVAHQGIADGSVDIHLGSWMPSMSETREAIEDNIEIVNTNMDEGLYTMAVPEYVWEAGVKSYSDLADYADRFNRTLYTGPVAWQSTEKMREAVNNDIYNLSDWTVQTSTQGALMARIKKAINNKEWITFIAWKPHWINYMLDIKYLKDPEGLWENPESWVDTLARKGFKADHPEVYQFFKQYQVTAKASDAWIYKIGRKSQEPDRVAKNWIKNNLAQVEDWLAGVEASNGQPAFEVLKNKIN